MTDSMPGIQPKDAITEVAVEECGMFPGDWIAEAIDSDGSIYQASFAGPDAKERAVEYATWKYGFKTEE